jgi:hypothetical protein
MEYTARGFLLLGNLIDQTAVAAEVPLVKSRRGVVQVVSEGVPKPI